MRAYYVKWEKRLKYVTLNIELWEQNKYHYNDVIFLLSEETE